SAMAVLNATMFMSLLTVGPLCLLTGLQRTAQHHVFVKDGRALEQLAHADTVVFDKTGAVTRDQLSVGQVHTCGEDEAATLPAHAPHWRPPVVLVPRHRRLAAAIELHATIRAEAQRVIAQLRRRGITTFYIISGDHETPTQRLAQAVGVDRYFADTLPQDKAVI